MTRGCQVQVQAQVIIMNIRTPQQDRDDIPIADHALWVYTTLFYHRNQVTVITFHRIGNLRTAALVSQVLIPDEEKKAF